MDARRAGRARCHHGPKHKEFSVEGVQFHPESILTEHGHDMLRNFLEQKG